MQNMAFRIVGKYGPETMHPTPWNDFELGWTEMANDARKFWYFGFNSLEQLKDWIPEQETRARLREHGFELYVLTFDDDDSEAYRHGDTQAIYKPGKAISKKRLDLAAV